VILVQTHKRGTAFSHARRELRRVEGPVVNHRHVKARELREETRERRHVVTRWNHDVELVDKKGSLKMRMNESLLDERAGETLLARSNGAAVAPPGDDVA
jgi:hypothetical protein